MRYLFIHQNFPGQFQHLVQRLVREGGNEIVFITNPNANRMAGVRRVEYAFDAPFNEALHPATRDVEHAMRRADLVAEAARGLLAGGFVPDIVIGHFGWGEMLNIRDVYPNAPVLGYCEFYYHFQGLDVNFDPEWRTPTTPGNVRAKNTINHLSMATGAWGQTPTVFQLSTYPREYQDRIMLIPEGVDLDKCRPDPSLREAPFALGDRVYAPGDRLVTFVARTLEPMRGYHTFMRSLGALMRERSDVRVVVVGGTDGGYGPRLSTGSWKDHYLDKVRHEIDESRLHFTGRLDYDDHLRLLRRSDAHVYLTYPFVASWSLREALGCGTPLVCADVAPVREFVRDGVNGLLVPPLSHDALSARVLALLDDSWLDGHLRQGARAFAERHLSMETYLYEYKRIIGTLVGTGGRLSGPGPRYLEPLVPALATR